jgi:chaperonin cofactor prefoldin
VSTQDLNAYETHDQEVKELTRRVADLRQQETMLRQEISKLQVSYSNMLKEQMSDAQAMVGRLVQEGLRDLEQRKQTLQISIEQLERRQERIRSEMRSTFAGASQDLAIRVQGFKDYLVGSLQDLATAAEQLELTPQSVEQPSVRPIQSARPEPEAVAPTIPRFAQQSFDEEAAQIRRIIDQYRTMPDYYGPPWQLRRTFEPVHADRVTTWFFTLGGRGALKTMGSRLQNILVASATISVLRSMHGDRLRALVLGNSPERLGEWRRGLQDCLGISRSDFGAQQGIVLFEAPEALAQRADRLVSQGQLPLILIDEAEEQVSLSLLQFPLWLAFAPDPAEPSIVF